MDKCTIDEMERRAQSLKIQLETEAPLSHTGMPEWRSANEKLALIAEVRALRAKVELAYAWAEHDATWAQMIGKPHEEFKEWQARARELREALVAAIKALQEAEHAGS